MAATRDRKAAHGVAFVFARPCGSTIGANAQICIGERFRPDEEAMRFDTIWLGARLATLSPARSGLGVIERGAVAVADGRIAFAVPMAELPTGWDAAERVALDGRWITPGFIDCHTHLV